ncbi:MAG: hypothetical protein DRG09_05170 [Epsilonproteobacteria bacterium]|nr:MAG: hypothetical protein DRG09_05170 [Campylobacterota bacterium]
MFAVALVFKTSVLSLWLAAKLHFVAFIAGLTFFQGLVLLIKRWLLDSVLATWIQTHIIENVIDALGEAKDFYLRQDLKSKFKNIFFFIFGVTLSGWVLYFIGLLDNIIVFAELRLFIAGVFTAIVTFITKIASWTLSILAISWLGPILKVFAFSYILTRLDTWLGPNNFISRFLNYIGDNINMMLYYLGILKEKHIDPLILDPVINKSKQMGLQLSSSIRNKKIREEYRHSENFENIIMKGHIEAYRSFSGLNKITDKTDLYTRINQKTGNNMDIVAYVSRSASGELMRENAPSNHYHDVLLLESFASHREHGVKIYDEPKDDTHINQKDFWVLNCNNYPVTIRSNTYNFENMKMRPHGLKLIKVKNPFCYKFGDIFCEYNDKRVAVTAIERV